MRNKTNNINKSNLFLWGLILLPYILLIPTGIWYFNKIKNIEHSTFVIINKADMNLSLYNYKGELLQKVPVTTGKNAGIKEVIGDNKTPEGIFTIASIEDASSWSHDFKDDSLGSIKGAYGPRFIRLNVSGQKGIGIHGTHDENSIGTRASEGCIRMHNADLFKLIENIQVTSVVIITPGIEDVKVNKQASDTIVSKKSSKQKTIKGKKELLVKQQKQKLNLKPNKKPLFNASAKSKTISKTKTKK